MLGNAGAGRFILFFTEDKLPALGFDTRAGGTASLNTATAAEPSARSTDNLVWGSLTDVHHRLHPGVENQQ